MPPSPITTPEPDPEEPDNTRDGQKKPVAWLPSFHERRVLRGERWLRLVLQLIVFLPIVAVCGLALMSALGIGKPAADALALLFGCVILLLLAPALVVFAPAILLKMMANASTNQPSPDLPGVDETRWDEKLLADQCLPAKPDEDFQRALDSMEPSELDHEFGIQSEDD